MNVVVEYLVHSIATCRLALPGQQDTLPAVRRVSFRLVRIEKADDDPQSCLLVVASCARCFSSRTDAAGQRGTQALPKRDHAQAPSLAREEYSCPSTLPSRRMLY